MPGPKTEKNVGRRPVIVVMEIFLKFRQLRCMLFVVKIVFSFHMCEESEESFQFILLRGFVAVGFEQCSNFLESSMLICIDKTHEAVAMWGAVALELCGETHCFN